MKLYHYTSIAKLLEILGTGSIKFGSLKRTNDPKEYFDPWIDLYIDCFFFEDVEGDIRKEIEKYQLLCFSKDDEIAGYKHPRMWTQYAQNHEGCCIEFEKELLDSQVAKICSVKKRLLYSDDIIYENIEKKLVYDKKISTKKFVIDNMHYLLFTKSSDWIQEKEYRYLVYNESDDDTMIPIESCITGFYFGHKFPKVLEEKVMEMFTTVTKFCRVTWKNGLCIEREGYKGYKDYLYKTTENSFISNCLSFNNDMHTMYSADPKYLLPALKQHCLISDEEYNELSRFWENFTAVDIENVKIEDLLIMRRDIKQILLEYLIKRGDI